MQKEKLDEVLFINEEGNVQYNLNAIDTPEGKMIQNIVTESELPQQFGIEVAYRAVSVVVEVDHINDEDLIREQIDTQTPIWTTELMDVYKYATDATDEAYQEYDLVPDDGSPTTIIAQVAWKNLIGGMVESIKKELCK